MEPKDEAKILLSSVSDVSGNKIVNSDDLLRIFEIVHKNELQEELSEVAFQAKFLQGLLRVIRNRDNSIEAEYFETVTKEYSEGMNKLKNSLEKIISNADDFYKNIFKEKFFEMSHKGMSNLTSLCDDLSWVKVYLNDEKYGAKARN